MRRLAAKPGKKSGLRDKRVYDSRNIAHWSNIVNAYNMSAK